jgi:DNA-binding transcriptional MerR regulator
MIKFPLDEFFDTKSIDKAIELRTKVSAQRFYVKDLEIKYRVINHWDSEGLIHCTRNAEGGDRKFSFADYVWIKVVEELRSFGVPIPTIKTIRDEIYEQLPLKEFYSWMAEDPSILDQHSHPDIGELKEFIKSKEYETADYSDFDFLLLYILLSMTIMSREAVSLIVFKDGEWFPYIPSGKKNYPDELLNKMKYSSHISICLLDIIFRFLSSDLAEKALKDLNLLSEKERQLLEEVNSNKFKTVKVSFRSKSQEPLEIKKGKRAKSQIIDILRNKEYRDFFITDNKGVEHKVK